ncbi:Fe-Mn family superoxide dismutase [Paenibacillus sp. YYML68]|uniref:Fe-Mn family superoxide dismutase n=1 Tax=Paenibacillus sp. YYML68 TaxID=2909250 RepID=UPI00249358FC|nr:Fe-Mn family superoxide dismutase [Paenibacillus sp. YYML68]
MLFVYGTMMPMRILEEIRFWKMQEREHTVVIRELVPNLEPEYVKLLEQWEGVFAKTEADAGRWIEAVIRSGVAVTPHIMAKVNELLQYSTLQSQSFIQQLFLMLDKSAPIQASPVIRAVMLHIIRESEYFLGVLSAVQGAAAIGGPRAIDPMYPQPHSPASAASTSASVSTPTPTYASTLSTTPAHAPHPIAAYTSLSLQTAAPETRPEAKLAYLHHIERSEETVPVEPYTATNEGTWSGSIRPGAPVKPVPIGGHKLPPLPYSYEALEPHIDAETMRLHHDKHHQSYVDGLNQAEKQLAKTRETGDYDLIKHWEREIAFNGAGHYLHTIFWNVMKPGGGGKATGPIAAEIKRSFGSFEAFQKHFSAAAEKVEGSGWAILVWSPRSHRLEILQAEKHQNLSQWDVIPLLVLDVWEHSYYLKYKNQRAKYIEAWWNTINWDHVNERFAAAQQLMWLPY